MFAMSKTRFAEALGGQLLVAGKAADLKRVSTDTRRIKRGDAFIGLNGTHFKGSRFAGEALKSGAALVAVEKAGDSEKRLAAAKGAALVQVEDGREALWRAAREQRRIYEGLVVGVTGSNGKTGSKELLGYLLGADTHITPGSYNNEIGLPLTLLGLERSHRKLVLEMGMNAAGEIRQLARLGRPQIGLVLNVGDAHVGRLGGRAAVAKAKEELIEAMGRGGWAVVNADDHATRAMAKRHDGRCLLFGKHPAADVKASAVRDKGARGLQARLSWPGGKGLLKIHRGGRPGLEQALAAFSVGLAAGMKPAAMLARLRAYRPATSMRLEMKKTLGIQAVLDSYNASPQSMAAALDYVALSAPRGKRVAVLGDMLELGAESERFHKLVGKVARQKGFRRLVAVGRHSRALAAGFGKGAEVFPRGAWSKAARWLAAEVKPSDWVLFKGSRGMAMEKVYSSLVDQLGAQN